MRLNLRLDRVEQTLLLKQSLLADPIFEYEVSTHEFDRICKNALYSHPLPPDRNILLKQFTKEQVDDIWRRHYNTWINNQLIEPTRDRIEKFDKLSKLCLEDWQRVFMTHILKYPHIIKFPLKRFSLESFDTLIKSHKHIVYSPVLK